MYMSILIRKKESSFSRFFFYFQRMYQQQFLATDTYNTQNQNPCKYKTSFYAQNMWIECQKIKIKKKKGLYECLFLSILTKNHEQRGSVHSLVSVLQEGAHRFF